MGVEFVLLGFEQIVEEVIIMSQQEMNYSELGRGRPGASGGYEGIPLSSSQEEGWGTPPKPRPGGYEGISLSSLQGEKLSGHAEGWVPTAGQRLALAIASLVMFIVMTFGLIGLAIATQAPSWAVLPILFILVLFATAAVIINLVFNRKP
jgi:hypothetical protein